MNVYIPLGLLLLLVSFLIRDNYNASRKFFLFGFFVMFVFAALRYNFGPDYPTYADNFGLMKQMGFEGFLEHNQHAERGFAFFFNLFDSFFVFIIFQSLIWLGVFYLFFKQYVEEKYYYVIILMMFFNINFSILNYTAIRSSLAGCFFFLGLSILLATEGMGLWGSAGLTNNKKNKKAWRLVIYLVLIYIGSLFHTSILFFLLFPFITNTKNISHSTSQGLLVLGIVLSIISVMFRSTFTLSLSLWVIDLVPSSFDRYSDYLDMINTAGGGLGALLFNAMKVVIAYPILNALTLEKDTRYIRLMQFAIIFLYSFLLINENLLSRFTMCFYPVIIVALLRSYKYVSSDIRTISLLSIVFLSLFQFYNGINVASNISFLEYRTIFSAPYWL